MPKNLCWGSLNWLFRIQLFRQFQISIFGSISGQGSIFWSEHCVYSPHPLWKCYFLPSREKCRAYFALIPILLFCPFTSNVLFFLFSFLPYPLHFPLNLFLLYIFFLQIREKVTHFRFPILTVNLIYYCVYVALNYDDLSISDQNPGIRNIMDAYRLKFKIDADQENRPKGYAYSECLYQSGLTVRYIVCDLFFKYTAHMRRTVCTVPVSNQIIGLFRQYRGKCEEIPILEKK
jgi:hypothetical protein